MYAKMIFPQYKVKMSHILQNMNIFCRCDEVSAIKKHKIITSSKIGSQIFFADFVFFNQNNDIPHTGKPLTTVNTTMWVKNSLEIALSLLVFEVFPF